MNNAERIPPFRLERAHREQAALYCTDCKHPVTSFIDANAVYIGCLKKSKKVSGHRWSDLEGPEDLFDSWERITFGHWPGVSEWMVDAIEAYTETDEQ